MCFINTSRLLEVSTEMIVSHKNKFIFFKPLKVAGTSIEALLSHSTGPVDLVTGSSYEYDIKKGFVQKNNIDTNSIGLKSLKFHSHTYPEMLYKKTNSKWEDYYKITAVRNPWDVCVSYYWWCMSEKNLPCKILESDGKHDYLRKFRMWLLSPISIDMFESSSEVYPSMISFLSKTNELYLTEDIDYTIKFENLNIDIDEVFLNLGISKKNKIKKFKSHTRNNKHHYSYYYDNLTASVVYKEFEKTISKFNYKF